MVVLIWRAERGACGILILRARLGYTRLFFGFPERFHGTIVLVNICAGVLLMFTVV